MNGGKPEAKKRGRKPKAAATKVVDRKVKAEESDDMEGKEPDYEDMSYE